LIDFIDAQRYAVQIPEKGSFIYAGTINDGCKQDDLPCSYRLNITDESELAESLVRQYGVKFPIASPMQTQLLTVPQSRTIEIRTGTARP
jgi:hypothetical protein